MPCYRVRKILLIVNVRKRNDKKIETRNDIITEKNEIKMKE
jgi:hypothetical protein